MQLQSGFLQVSVSWSLDGVVSPVVGENAGFPVLISKRWETLSTLSNQNLKHRRDRKCDFLHIAVYRRS